MADLRNSSVVIIRHLDRDDFARVDQLDPGTWVEIGFNSILMFNHDTCFAAEKDGELVGFLICVTTNRTGHVVKILTDERYRRQGIAKHLVDSLIKVAQEKNLVGHFEIASTNYETNELAKRFASQPQIKPGVELGRGDVLIDWKWDESQKDKG